MLIEALFLLCTSCWNTVGWTTLKAWASHQNYYCTYYNIISAQHVKGIRNMVFTYRAAAFLLLCGIILDFIELFSGKQLQLFYNGTVPFGSRLQVLDILKVYPIYIFTCIYTDTMSFSSHKCTYAVFVALVGTVGYRKRTKSSTSQCSDMTIPERTSRHAIVDAMTQCYHYNRHKSFPRFEVLLLHYFLF